MIELCKLPGIPDDYTKLSFGRKLEYSKQIQEFKNNSKSTWLSQKRQSWKKALKEFKNLYKPRYYYAKFHCEPYYWDDSFEIWYEI